MQPTSSPIQALRLLVRIRQTSRTRITGAAIASAAHRDPGRVAARQVVKPDGQRQHERADDEAGQRIGQGEGRPRLVRSQQPVLERTASPRCPGSMPMLRAGSAAGCR